jgi:chaperonin GroES
VNKKIRVEEVLPLRDRVIIKLTQQEHEVTRSGILLPAEDKPAQNPNMGEVVAVGDGMLEDKKKAHMPFELGDIVLFTTWNPNDITSIFESDSDEQSNIATEKYKYISVAASDIIAKIISKKTGEKHA